MFLLKIIDELEEAWNSAWKITGNKQNSFKFSDQLNIFQV